MRKKTSTFYIVAIVLVFVLWFWCGRSVVTETVYPVENGVSWFQRHVALPLTGFFRSGRVAAENARLRAELEALKMKKGDVEALTARVDELHRLLRLDTSNPVSLDTWIYAPVLSREGPVGLRNRLRVKGGSLNGVTTNAVVAVPAGLVGRVIDVTPRTATVQLLTDPALRVACQIVLDDSPIGPVLGILNGGGTFVPRPEADCSFLYLVNNYRLRHLKRDLDIPEGARIVTSGLGGVYPPGLSVGTLTGEPRADETRLEWEAAVLPAVDFPALREVFIRREN